MDDMMSLRDTTERGSDRKKVKSPKICPKIHSEHNANVTKRNYSALAAVAVVSVFLMVAISTSVLTEDTNTAGFSSNSNSLNKEYRREIASNEFPYRDLRLPKHIFPIHYQLHLRHDLDNLIIHGHSQIVIGCTRKTNFIVFHHNDSIVLSVNIALSSNVSNKLQIRDNRYSSLLQLRYLQFDQDLLPNVNYTLTIQFRSKIYLNSINGLYRSTYTDGNNEIRYAYVTHFEPVYTRLAFPCFDEPSMKATFKLFITRPREYGVLSNMPLKTDRIISNSSAEAEFKTTPRMSSYVVAYTILNYTHISTKTSTGIKIRAWAAPAKIDQMRLSLDYGRRSLELYEKLFGVSYPLPKLDLVCVKKAGISAMENWGLITFPEESCLYYPKTGTNKHRVTATPAHEIAHHWVGDLVSIGWWSELFLKEGFATVMEFYSAYYLKSPKLAQLQFFRNKWEGAIKRDISSTSHSVSTPVDTPAQINAIFDGIIYQKGSCMLRMIEQFMGREKFFKGVNLYLNKFKYNAAFGADLWNSLSQVTHYDINSIMKPWIHKIGFPIITALVDRNRHKVTFSVSLYPQKRKVQQNSIDTKNSEIDRQIPFTFRTNMVHNGKFLIKRSADSMALKSPFQWFKANVNSSGYYCVNYDHDTWNQLIQLLKIDHKKLSPSDRADLITDSCALAEIGELNINIFFGTTEYLIHEKDELPRDMAYNCLKKIRSSLQRKADRDNLLKYIAYLKLKPPPDLDKDNLEMDDYSFQLSSQNDNKEDSLEKQLLALIHDGTPANWYSLFYQYKMSKRNWEKISMIKALASTPHQFLIKSLLELSLTNKELSPSDLKDILVAISRNRIHRKSLLNFMTENWKQLAERSSPVTMKLILDDLVQQPEIHDNTLEVRDFIQLHSIVFQEALQNDSDERENFKFSLTKINSNRASHWLRKKIEKLKNEGIFN
ncbi:Endoplasmic reticulum aminopeptidase 2 [Trichoplax sp. H2]|nr:Endoplasmic reticulum aminopeptidase 2 [Trichoplax sp. H2]|eukprot:RDD39797.1 Endoplasmic reticulum aminopeptidase 2 [Trichoplax sp. H2]